jgi:hypothetical protein
MKIGFLVAIALIYRADRLAQYGQAAREQAPAARRNHPVGPKY